MYCHPHWRKHIAPLDCQIYSHASLLPPISTDANPTTTFALGAYAQGKAIAKAHRFVWGERFSRQLPPLPIAHTINQEVIYGGVFLSHWGHFLIESLQRLWYAKGKDLPIVWFRDCGYDSNSPFFSKRHEEVLQAIGIQNKHIHVKQPSEFAKVHFPDPGFELGHYAHPQHIDSLGYYQGKVRQGRYVYLSRSHFPHCVNEKALEQRLHNLGWEIIHPELLSLTEQLDILTTAQVCLMQAGSAQHTLLLTQNTQTRFIIIPRTHTLTYDLISNSKAQEYYLFHAEKKVLNAGMGSQNDKFSLHIEQIQNIILQSQHFTTHLAPFAPLIQEHSPVPLQCLHVPTYYSLIDTCVTKGEELYYSALYAAQNQDHEKAYNLCMELHAQKLLEPYMYDYFFSILERHDAISGNISPLCQKKNQFLLMKALKEVEKNAEHGENYIRLAQALQNMQRYTAALEVLQRARQKFPFWALPLACAAQIHMDMGQINEAFLWAQKAFHLEPHDGKIKKVLAHCMHLQEKSKDDQPSRKE